MSTIYYFISESNPEELEKFFKINEAKSVSWTIYVSREKVEEELKRLNWTYGRPEKYLYTLDFSLLAKGELKVEWENFSPLPPKEELRSEGPLDPDTIVDIK